MNTPLFDSGLFDSGRHELGPGAVHVPGWLDLAQQREIVTACREWARGPVPMRAASLPSGHKMSVRMVCLGWHWQPYRYSRTVDGSPVAPLPAWLAALGRQGIAAAYDDATPYRDPTAADAYEPDTALVNFYDEHAKMGMHQDKDERSEEPVVSLSIGDTCVFRFGNTENRKKLYTDLDLASGDLFVFGGESRFAYHGVTGVYPGSGDPRTGLESGRLNITLRVTGLN